MKNIRLVLILTFAFKLISAQTPEHILEEYQLVWQDEFDGDKLDESKWNYRAEGTKRGFATVRKENSYLDGKGHLIIEASKEDTNYYVSQIATYNKASFQYGYFECKLQVNQKLGPSTAFWIHCLEYTKHVNDLVRGGAEIDVVEYRRKFKDDEVYHTIHWDGYGSEHKQHGKIKKVKGIDDGFHTFAVEWTADKYIFYVDGKKTWQTKTAVSMAKQYLILSVEMNDWSGDPSGTTFPDKAVFDYVRVYQKK